MKLLCLLVLLQKKKIKLTFDIIVGSNSRARSLTARHDSYKIDSKVRLFPGPPRFAGRLLIRFVILHFKFIYTKGEFDMGQVVLVDMDGVVTDFEGGLLNIWKRLYPGRFFIPPEQRRTFYMQEEYPEECRDDMWAIYTEAGFFWNLPEVPGATAGFKRLVDMGYDLWICTTPMPEYENCVTEKFHWVKEHLGFEWTKKLILARDKTMVYGHYLIDDRPEIVGINSHPMWEHIVFDAPYNRNSRSIRRMTWSSVTEVFG